MIEPKAARQENEKQQWPLTFESLANSSFVLQINRRLAIS